ncbi:MAG: DUF6516 family protein [Caenispirillum sp.]|nr:DUF6516 family protein [Caenispirillum sp.]
MPADLLFHQKFLYGDDMIVEMKIWRVPEPVAGSVHAFKYSLYFGRAGKRIVGYDNERGKGDHRHYFDREEPYHFTTVEQLMADFLADVRSARQ